MSDSAPMTPEGARDDLIHLDDFEVGDVYKTCRQALETIANMDYDAQYIVEMGRVFVNDVDRVKFPDGTKVTRRIGDWEAVDE